MAGLIKSYLFQGGDVHLHNSTLGRDPLNLHRATCGNVREILDVNRIRLLVVGDISEEDQVSDALSKVRAGPLSAVTLLCNNLTDRPFYCHLERRNVYYSLRISHARFAGSSPVLESKRHRHTSNRIRCPEEWHPQTGVYVFRRRGIQWREHHRRG